MVRCPGGRSDAAACVRSSGVTPVCRRLDGVRDPPQGEIGDRDVTGSWKSKRCSVLTWKLACDNICSIKCVAKDSSISSFARGVVFVPAPGARRVEVGLRSRIVAGCRMIRAIPST